MACATQQQHVDCTQSTVCAICLEQVRDPRLLSCCHSFCKRCLDDLDLRSGPYKLTCPVCRAVTQLRSGGAESLPKDITRTVQCVLECSTCKSKRSEGKAETYCSECDIHFCKDHTLPHILLNPGHAVSALGVQAVSPTTGTQKTSTEATGLCPEHKLPLKYFCKSCSCRICAECIIGGVHQGHKPHVSVREVPAWLRESVSSNSDQLQVVALCIEKSLSDVETTCAKLTSAADQVRVQVRLAQKRAVDAIDAIADQKLIDVDCIEQTLLKDLNNRQDKLKDLLRSVKGVIAFSKRLLEEHTQTDNMCELLFAVEKRGSQLKEVRVPDRPPQHNQLAYQDVLNDDVLAKATDMIGQVLVGQWEAPAQFSHFEGSYKRYCPLGSLLRFMLVCKDDYNMPLTEGGDNIQTEWLEVPAESDQTASDPPLIVDNKNGTYMISFRAHCVGCYSLQVSVNNAILQDHLSIECFGLFTFNDTECQPGILISEDGLSATHTGPNKTCASVLGQHGMASGQHTWKVQVTESIDVDMYVGVACREGLTAVEQNYDFTYSWYGYDVYKCIMGHRSDSACEWQKGDTLQFVLDCDAHTLSITNLRTRVSDMIEGLPKRTLFPYFELYNENDSLSLVT